MSHQNTGSIASSIQAQIGLSHGMLTVNRPGKLWAVIELSAADSGRTGESADEACGKSDPGRLPLNINAVLDRSDSMRGQPIEQVKQATKFLVEQIGGSDVLSLTIFDHEADVVFPSQKVTNKDIFKTVVDSIWSRGSTNLSGGLLRGYEEALRECRPGQVNRVLLLTDGMANVGVTDPNILSAKASSMLEKGVSLSTVGVGLHFDEDLLIALAEAGGGSYYYVKDAEDIPGVFSAELKGLLSVVAQGITLKVHGLSGCKVTGVLGYRPSFSDGNASLLLPDMFRDEEKWLAVEIAHPALPEGEHPVLRVVLSYTDAIHDLADTSLEVTAKLSAAPGVAEPREPNFEVIKVVELAKTAIAKDQSAEAMDRGDYREARTILENRLVALQSLKRSAAVPSSTIESEIDLLQTLAEQITEDAVLASQSQTRKDLRSQSYSVRHSQAEYREKKQS
ncbi:MAG: VWA domain-containing protein [Firmicutes bacterium]|nr:VWA domain-containing protein [Bacillota bacterium]